MFQEVLFLKLGSSVAKAILGVWLKDSGFLGDLAGGIVDIATELGIDIGGRRRLEREFHAVADRVAEALIPFFETEGAKLDEGEKTAVVLAVASAVENVDMRIANLVESFDLRASKLSKAIVQAGQQEFVHLSADGVEFAKLTAQEVSRYIIECAARLPDFSTSTFSEVLQRQSSILKLVEEVLQELERLRETARLLNPAEEMGKFEQRYRVALSHKNDEVELFGLEAPSKIRRQNLDVAYVTLSMSRKNSAKATWRRFPSLDEQRAIVMDLDALQMAAETSLHHADEAAVKDAVERGAAAKFRISHIGEWSVALTDATLKGLKKHFASLLVPNEETCDSVVASSPKLLIRGEAGSGKTTLLQWIVVNVASQRMQGPLESWNTSVPLLVRLREYSNCDLPSPAEIVRSSVPEIADSMPAGWAESILADGRAVVLVDGVDELDDIKRSSVRDWIRGLAKMYPDCRYILTSRPPAVEENWLRSEGFDEADLLPMSWSDIDNLIDHWHNALAVQPTTPESRQELYQIADHLRTHLRQNKALGSLATLPLLCAMLCALHYQNRQQLPANRIALYDAAVRMLLDQRDRVRGVTYSDLPRLSEEQKRAFLESIAYRMLRNGLATSQIDDVQAEIDRARRIIQGLPADIPSSKILDLLIQRSGIVRSPAERQVDFVHKTFQEFLCARAIVDVDDLNFLVTQAQKDLWYEVIILAAGIASFKRRNELLQAIIDRGDKEASVRNKLYLLAVSCLETALKLSPETERLLNDRLEKVIPPRSMKDARALGAAGELATPLLRRKTTYSAREAAACVRALATIGSSDALDQLKTYSADTRKTVIRELIVSWRHFDHSEYAQKVLADSPLESGTLSLSRPLQLNGLKHLKHLRALRIDSASRLNSLQGLEALKDLKKLYARDLSGIETLEPLSALKKLESLELERMPHVTDLTPLEQHSELRVLSLRFGSAINDLSFIKGLRKLEGLRLHGLPNAKNLNEVRLPSTLGLFAATDVSVQSFRMLEDCKDIQYVYCRNNPQSDGIECFRNFEKLSSLHLVITDACRDLSFLPEASIRRLELERLSSIQDYTHLERYSKCMYLSLSEAHANRVFNAIRDFSSLVELSLNRASEFSETFSLPAAEGLRVLRLSNSAALTRLPDLRSLPNLSHLDLRGCVNLKELAPIAGAPRLTSVFVSSELDPSALKALSHEIKKDRPNFRISIMHPSGYMTALTE